MTDPLREIILNFESRGWKITPSGELFYARRHIYGGHVYGIWRVSADDGNASLWLRSVLGQNFMGISGNKMSDGRMVTLSDPPPMWTLLGHCFSSLTDMTVVWPWLIHSAIGLGCWSAPNETGHSAYPIQVWRIDKPEPEWVGMSVAGGEAMPGLIGAGRITISGGALWVPSGNVWNHIDWPNGDLEHDMDLPILDTRNAAPLLLDPSQREIDGYTYSYRQIDAAHLRLTRSDVVTEPIAPPPFVPPPEPPPIAGGTIEEEPMPIPGMPDPTSPPMVIPPITVDPGGPVAVGGGAGPVIVTPSLPPPVRPVLTFAGRFEVGCKAADTRLGPIDCPPVLLGGDTGAFHYGNPSNLEVFVKVIDGRAVNGRYWVFLAGLTDVGLTVTVKDLQTGAIKTYSNTQGAAFQPVQDTSAFEG